MENFFDDSLLPENFEQMAKAYSESLKNKGFVFVRLEEEEFNLLVSEVFVIVEKMQACLKKLEKRLNSQTLQNKLVQSTKALKEKFGHKKIHTFECVEDENSAFLCLVALENLLLVKLTLLGIKSGELELCCDISTGIARIFSEFFPLEGFRVVNS